MSTKTFRLLLGGLLVCLFMVVLLVAAEENYRYAVSDSILSEGSDWAIDSTMTTYGFTDLGWYETPTTTEKVIAIFKNKH